MRRDLPRQERAFGYEPRLAGAERGKKTIQLSGYVVGEGGLLVISPVLRHLIDAHDPGRHYIRPMTLLTKRAVQHDGEFFAFVPGDACVLAGVGSRAQE